MSSTNTKARRAGVLYFLFMIVAIVSEYLFPSFRVSGDASATAGNITAAQLTYQLEILAGFVTLIIFIFLVVSLYDLFEAVDKSLGMLMVLLVSIGVAISLANLFNKFAPLVILSGADYLSEFTKPQLDTLALGFLEFHRKGASFSMAFWGLWLFPFGLLVVRSGFLPRVLGILLFIAGFAYLTSGVTSIVLPEHRQAVSRILMPLYFGEVPIVFWLLIKGAKVQQPQAQSSPVS